MAKRRGWAGSPPQGDDDARERIVEAAARCVDRLGPAAFSLSEVAHELGVSRPTLYRYFPSTDELLSAVGRHVTQEFNQQMRSHLNRFTDPVDWIVEGMASLIEWLPSRPRMTLLLDAGRVGPFARGMTSTIAVEMTREEFQRASIDWAALGFSPRDLDDLIEVMLRLVASMLIAPPDPPWSKAKLRRFLRRWVGPAIENVTRSLEPV